MLVGIGQGYSVVPSRNGQCPPDHKLVDRGVPASATTSGERCVRPLVRPPGPRPTTAAGSPSWVLPVALGGGALALIALLRR